MSKKKSLDDMLAMVSPNSIYSEVTTGNTVEKEIVSFKTHKYLEQRANKASVEKFKYVLSKVPEGEPSDYVELEKDMTRTSMNTMLDELKNDTW